MAKELNLQKNSTSKTMTTRRIRCISRYSRKMTYNGPKVVNVVLDKITLVSPYDTNDGE